MNKIREEQAKGDPKPKKKEEKKDTGKPAPVGDSKSKKEPQATPPAGKPESISERKKSINPES